MFFKYSNLAKFSQNKFCTKFVISLPVFIIKYKYNKNVITFLKTCLQRRIIVCKRHFLSLNYNTCEKIQKLIFLYIYLKKNILTQISGFSAKKKKKCFYKKNLVKSIIFLYVRRFKEITIFLWMNRKTASFRKKNDFQKTDFGPDFETNAVLPRLRHKYAENLVFGKYLIFAYFGKICKKSRFSETKKYQFPKISQQFERLDILGKFTNF